VGKKTDKHTKGLKAGKAQVLTGRTELLFHAEHLTPHKLQILH
jgi:hypothetical protein